MDSTNCNIDHVCNRLAHISKKAAAKDFNEAQDTLLSLRRNRALSSQVVSRVLDVYTHYAINAPERDRDRARLAAESLFAEMKRSEVYPPTSLAYCTMINMYAKFRMTKKAMSLFDEIRKGEAPPYVQADHVVWTIIIDMWSKQKTDDGYAKATELFDQMIREGIQPNDFMCCSLMFMYARKGNVTDARRIYNFVIDNRLIMTEYILGAGFIAADKAGDLEFQDVLITELNRWPRFRENMTSKFPAVASVLSRRGDGSRNSSSSQSQYQAGRGAVGAGRPFYGGSSYGAPHSQSESAGGTAVHKGSGSGVSHTALFQVSAESRGSFLQPGASSSVDNRHHNEATPPRNSGVPLPTSSCGNQSSSSPHGVASAATATSSKVAGGTTTGAAAGRGGGTSSGGAALPGGQISVTSPEETAISTLGGMFGGQPDDTLPAESELRLLGPVIMKGSSAGTFCHAAVSEEGRLVVPKNKPTESHVTLVAAESSAGSAQLLIVVNPGVGVTLTNPPFVVSLRKALASVPVYDSAGISKVPYMWCFVDARMCSEVSVVYSEYVFRRSSLAELKANVLQTIALASLKVASRGVVGLRCYVFLNCSTLPEDMVLSLGTRPMLVDTDHMHAVAGTTESTSDEVKFLILLDTARDDEGRPSSAASTADIPCDPSESSHSASDLDALVLSVVFGLPIFTTVDEDRYLKWTPHSFSM